MGPTDAELIARTLAEDDRFAFGELVRRHQSGVRLFLRRMAAGDAALADDLAQEAFVEAWKNLARFRGASRFGTWVTGIAYNRFRAHLRRRRPEEEFAEEEHAPDGAPSPARGAALRADLEKALARLPEGERAALELCGRLDFTHEEAAATLGQPLGTVKTNLLRGKERMRTWLKAWATN